MTRCVPHKSHFMPTSANAHDLPLFLHSSARESREPNSVSHHNRSVETALEPWKLLCSSHSLDDESDDDEPPREAPPHWAPKPRRRLIVPSPKQAQTLA
ncbi:hypothetical protein AB1Y20_014155 [Prymnesium parvum]|uniref:Uncharacterized protein n=1 Tax=Prymnesium parvum TaxID=97485 RepID=A0AB34IG13_PRYPA